MGQGSLQKKRTQTLTNATLNFCFHINLLYCSVYHHIKFKNLQKLYINYQIYNTLMYELQFGKFSWRYIENTDKLQCKCKDFDFKNT